MDGNHKFEAHHDKRPYNPDDYAHESTPFTSAAEWITHSLLARMEMNLPANDNYIESAKIAIRETRKAESSFSTPIF